MNWLISANGKIYNHSESFEKHGYIDWRQTANYEVGDIIYIYSTRPLSRIEFKCIVEQNNINFEATTGDSEFWIDKDEYQISKKRLYSRLRLLGTTDSDELTLNKLKDNGLKAAPQGPMRLKNNLLKHVEQNFFSETIESIFPNEINDEKELYEGSITKVSVNRYERDRAARSKCINYYGSNCMVCNFNFSKTYGDFAKDFIHVHHIVPLSQINKEYKVDYKKDLVPVCPNCHAMLHNKKGGTYPTLEQLNKIIMKSKCKDQT